MRSEPYWLSLEDILSTNKDEVEKTGETYFVRDNGLLESAIAKPRNYWLYSEEDDVVVLAVKLLLGISQNHPFEQGNKRTAFLAAASFLEANGYTLIAEDSESLGKLLELVIVGTLSEEGFTEIFRDLTKPQPDE